MEYARRPERYLMLPQLAIGSRGPVQSVLLLSRVPVRELAGERILVSAETHTSAMLLELLLRRWWRVPARLVAGSGPATSALEGDAAPPVAVLAIGDEALMLRSCAHYPYQLDLGEVWHRWTGLPFVFGLWVLRREYARRAPEAAAAACQTLQRGKAWGLANLEELLPVAGAGFPMSRDELRRYFQGLSFDLGIEEQQGLRRFFTELERVGLLERAPELHFFERQTSHA